MLLRALAVACAVALVFVPASGAGSSLRTLARHYAGTFLGDPHPRVLRIRTVRVVNGDRVAVIQMRGHFTFISYGPAPSSHGLYAVMEIALPSRSLAGTWGSSAAEILAIRRARRASPLFRIFPDFLNERILCRIPRGGPVATSMGGTCSTGAVRQHGRIKQIEFDERWPLNKRSGTRIESGWIVSLDRHGHVRSIRTTGQTPPQVWR